MKTPVPGDQQLSDIEEAGPNILPQPIRREGKHKRRKHRSRREDEHKPRNYDEYSFGEKYKPKTLPVEPLVEHRTKVKLLVSTNAIPFTCEETSVTFPLHVVKYHDNYECFDVGINLLSFQAIFSLRILTDYVKIQEMEQQIIQLEQKLGQIPCCSLM